MQLFPSTVSRFVDSAGRIIQPFISYLQQFTVAPSNILHLPLGASPYSYQVKETGTVFIRDGVVSDIHLERGSFSIDMTGQAIIPVGIKDTMIITYSVLPTFYFIPSYGNING